MRIGGIQKITLLDYPEKTAATIFTSGCNFRCPFCHNPELVLPEQIKENPPIEEEEIFNFLKKRKGFLQGLVICGGEPTIHNDLPEFIEKIKAMDYLVKLDTNGSNPEMLQALINKRLIDYVAMDIKAPKEKYNQLTGVMVDIRKIEQSVETIKNSSIDYEFRTTVVPGLLEKDDILKIAKWISPAKKYFLQNFEARENTVDPNFEQKKPYSEKYLEEIKEAIKNNFEVCAIRQ